MFVRGTVLEIIGQAMSELGLSKPVTVVDNSDVTATQFLALLTSAAAEMVNYYKWEQLQYEFLQTTVALQEAYELPADFLYMVDQSQWDRTNHWPLLGPKSAQEWQWLKGGMLSQGPRLRYRIRLTKLFIHPIPGETQGTATDFDLAMEYISGHYVLKSGGDESVRTDFSAEIVSDGDTIWMDKWLLSKYVKLKFWETKGFDTTAFRDDFLYLFNNATGRDKGAPVLSMTQKVYPILIGPWSVPDGSWPVSGSGSAP